MDNYDLMSKLTYDIEDKFGVRIVAKVIEEDNVVYVVSIQTIGNMREGRGTRAMNYLIDWSRKRGYSGVELVAMARSPKDDDYIARWYERLGFKRVVENYFELKF